LYETTVNTTVNEVVDELIQSNSFLLIFKVNNFRVLIDRLAVSIEDLATHGVIKPDELRGLSPQETEEFDAYQYIIKTLVQLYPKSMPGSQKDPPYNKDSEYMMILTTKDLV